MLINAKACIISPIGTELSPREQGLYAEQQPWGIVLMGRSCQSPEQIRRLIDQIWNALGRACMVFIDQEGGRVARLREPHFREFPPAAFFESLGFDENKKAARATYLNYRLMGGMLADLGIHGNFAPTLDLRVADTDPVIGDRAFSKSGMIIADLGEAALRGLADASIIGCIKHMPGHGRALVDSHKTLPRVSASAHELAEDILPFQKLAKQALIGMTAHIAYDGLGIKGPITQDQDAIDRVIRQQIGFDGLLVTDDLGMNALGGGLKERALASQLAGCDMLLHCSGFLTDADEIFAEMSTIAKVAKPISGKVQKRCEAVELAAVKDDKADLESLEAEWQSLITHRA